MMEISDHFSDPDQRNLPVVRLFAACAAMSRASPDADACDWSAIAAHCTFWLDHCTDGRTGNPFMQLLRYHVLDEIDNEMPTHLLALDAERLLRERLVAKVWS